MAFPRSSQQLDHLFNMRNENAKTTRVCLTDSAKDYPSQPSGPRVSPQQHPVLKVTMAALAGAQAVVLRIEPGLY